MSILRKGLTGAPVKRLQERLGIGADGIFGPGTEKALRAYQAENGLVVDGIAGPDTFTAMGLHELVLLRRGSRGTTVRKMQEALGIGADGIFGKGTEAAVKRYQETNGLAADGMAGPHTLASMAGFGEITDAVIARSTVQPGEEHFEIEPLPELSGIDFSVPKDPIPLPENKSVWGRVKGWFS